MLKTCPAAARAVDRQAKRLGDVADMHEVAMLAAILEDQGRLPVQQSRTKVGQHAGIGIGQCLSGSEHVEQPQCNRVDSVVGANDETASFLAVLGQGVDRGEIGLLLLIGRHRDQAGSIGQNRIPAGRGTADATPNGTNRRAVFGRVSAFAIHAHRRCDDQTFDRIADQLLQQHRRPEIVDADVAGDLIHALADADFCGEMDHAIDAFESGRHRFGIANIASDQFERLAVTTAGRCHAPVPTELSRIRTR